MAYFFKFIPSIPTKFFSCYIPVFSKLSDVADSGNSLIFSNLNTDNFYSLCHRSLNLWGVNINVVDRYCHFVGPSLLHFDYDSTNYVFGIDEVEFPLIYGDLEIPITEHLTVADSYFPIDRDFKYKINNEALIDYKPAVDDGTNIIKKYGIRAGSNVDFLGEVFDSAGEDFECAMLICKSNKKEFNPYVVKTFYGKTEDVEVDLVEFMSTVSILNKEYSNFYMFREKVDPGKYILGMFNVSSVLVQYDLDTSVYLIGRRDHHENAGLPSKKENKKDIEIESKLRERKVYDL